MKRTLTLILAALLLASSLASCVTADPKETEAETKAVETNAPATDPVETNAPEAAYDPSLITENGIAKAKIVVAEGADAILTFAAEELQYHIAKVSGAEAEITSVTPDDALPIIIATPDSNPELAELFPEDLEWLTTLKEDGKNWGDDGFAIRTTEKAIYIFGATTRGALNGVYDFIEENLGVLWVRADEEKGLIYDEMPTITLTRVDYREKSPFDQRIIDFYGGSDAESVPATERMLSRNKINVIKAMYTPQERLNSIGVTTLCDSSIKNLILQSPIYDPNCNEYWETDKDGNHLTYETSLQINIWSDLVVDTIAATILQNLDKTPAKASYYAVNLEDCLSDMVYPECTEPYEYAPGEFVEPSDPAYYSTVYYDFINKIADKVAEKYPDVGIKAAAYYQTLTPPKCELRDNVAVLFSTINEDLTQPFDQPQGQYPELDWAMLQEWLPITDNLLMYGYYGCCYTMGWYERPVWYRMQDDFRYYAENGLLGIHPPIYYDSNSSSTLVLDKYNWGYTNKDNWDTNMMTHWLITKLSWNPYEDVDALIEYYCDKVYGEAADEMLEYYRILKMGWDDGAETLYSMFNANIRWNSPTMDIYYNFLDTTVDDIYIIEGLGEALDKAWEAADDRAKEFIARRRECLTVDAWEGFLAYTQNFN